MRRLTSDEYEATMGHPPRRVGLDEDPPFDFWTYFDSIPRDDWEGNDFSAGTVSYAYEMPGRLWQHVLVESRDKSINMVLVLDLVEHRVHGHHLLDLGRLYGLDSD